MLHADTANAKTITPPIAVHRRQPAIAVRGVDVLAHRSSKMTFTNRNDLRQALRLDRADESLCVRVEIRAAARKPHVTHTKTFENLSETLREERIPVVNEVAATKQESLLGIGEVRAI